MFMHEYHVIDSAESVDKLRLRLRQEELEQYGEAFIPEFVYEVIRRLPRFSSMRVSHFELGTDVYAKRTLAWASTRCRGILGVSFGRNA